MTIVLSDELISRYSLPEEEFLVDFACFLYEKRRLTMGRATKLAGMDRISFQKELAKRDIYLNYTEEDIDIELQNLGLL